MSVKEKIDRAIEEIRIGVREYMEESGPPKYNLHLNPTAGVGKTWTVAEEMERGYYTYAYLTDKHRIGDEKLNEIPAFFDLVHIESRYRLCDNPQFKVLGKYNINIKPYCKECPYFKSCKYNMRIRMIWDEPQSWIGVHHHLGGLANKYVNECAIDCVIIDEQFLSAIFKNFKFGFPLIQKTLLLLKGSTKSPERQLIEDYLNECNKSLVTGKVNYEFLLYQVYVYFKDYGDYETLRNYAKEYELRLANYFFQSRKIFTNIVTNLVEIMIDIFNHHTLRFDEPDAYIYIENVIRISYDKKKNKRMIDIARFDLKALDLKCRVLILDATTPTDFYRNIFPRAIKTISETVELNSHIFQISGAKYVMQTLDQGKALNRLLNLTQLIVNKHEQEVLVVSRKKYKEKIQALNPQYIVTDHYPILGSNDYEHIDVFIAFGTPEPNPFVLERQAILLDVDIEELHYIQREAYIIQALHRIRPARKWDKETYIYLFTNIPLHFKNIKKLTIGRLTQLLKYNIAEYFTEEKEQQIRNEIFDLLEDDVKTATELRKGVKGPNVVINEIIKRLEQDHVLGSYAGRKPGVTRGRPAKYYYLIDDEDE